MGEYTGRRRGRAAPEPSPQEPEYTHAEDPAYQQGYVADNSGYEQGAYGYEQPVAEYQSEYHGYESGYTQGYETQQQYGYEAPHQQGYEYVPEYTQDPDYGYQNAPSYEQYPSYEQHPSYEQQYQGYDQQTGAYYNEYAQEYQEQPYPQAGYQQDGYEHYEGYQEPYYEEQPYTGGEPYPNADGYADANGYPNADGYSGTEAYPANYADGYTDGYPDNYSDDYSDVYTDVYAHRRDTPDYPDSYLTPDPTPRPHLSPLAHLPYTAAATAALAITAFVSAKAVAAVVLPLQLVVAWAVLDLAGFASRRTAVVAALPAMAGAAATFKFQPDDSVLPVAAGLGAGFVLIAADAVFRARRRGVEPGSVRALAAAASALLFAGLTGMFVPAAVLHLTSVAAGAGVCAVLSVSAARNAELGSRRAAVVAIPVTIAALASYAAAILVP